MNRSYVIAGDCIAKKNSQRIIKFKKKGRWTRRIRPSIAYEKYANIAVQELKWYKKTAFNYPVLVEMYFYRRTNRKFDIDNMIGSVLDILVNSGVIEDDSMRHVIPKIRNLGWEIDKKNPRTEVKIYACIASDK